MSIKQCYLYAAAYLPFGMPFCGVVYDEDYNAHDVIYKDTYQYKRLTELNAFAIQHNGQLAPYISNCDVLRQFAAMNK